MSISPCVFCRIVDRLTSARIVWEGEDGIAFLDQSPINRGHLVIIPRVHVAKIWDLEEPTFLRLLSLVRRLAVPLAKAMLADRAAMAVEGYGVPHAHVHLVPVNGGNELDPCRQVPASEDDLDVVAECIRENFSKSLAI